MLVPHNFELPVPERLLVYDMPLIKFMGRNQVDGTKVANLLRNQPIRFAVIEDVSSMPGEGVVSVFRFGYNAGVLLGVLQALDIKVLRVKPSVWKPALGLSSDKKKSLALAKKRFPRYSHHFSRAKDDGRAEAALIAHFASESL